MTKFKTWLTRTRNAIVGALLAVLGALGLYQAAESQQTATQDTLRWSMPTQYVDGSAIPAGTLTGARIAWGTAPGGPYPNTQDLAGGTVTTITLTRTDPYGQRCYRVAALIGATNGEWSSEACKTVQAPPKAPTGLTAE